MHGRLGSGQQAMALVVGSCRYLLGMLQGCKASMRVASWYLYKRELLACLSMCCADVFGCLDQSTDKVRVFGRVVSCVEWFVSAHQPTATYGPVVVGAVLFVVTACYC